MTIAVGVAALVIMVGLARTRVATLSSLVALVVPSLVVVVVGLPSVLRVDDVASIPSGFPALSLPDVSLLSVDLVLAAFSLAAIIAIQGVGVSQAVENPDDSEISASGDMLAQGVGNIAAGLFSGIPAGGSVGQTALNVTVGARSRWAGVLSGVWMLAFVVALPAVVAQVPMTVLAALMIIAGVGAISSREARAIWTAGWPARASILVTFAATMVLSIPLAVALGVVLSVLVFVARSGSDIRLRHLQPVDGGGFVELDELPAEVADRAVTVLEADGSMFFAGARTLAERLPSARGSTEAVVVLRLRGHSEIGATFIAVLDDYADDLQAGGGRLHLTGLSPEMATQLRLSDKLDLGDTVHLATARPRRGASTHEAVEDARTWLGRRREAPAENTDLRRPHLPVLPEGALRAPTRREPGR